MTLLDLVRAYGDAISVQETELAEAIFEQIARLLAGTDAGELVLPPLKAAPPPLIPEDAASPLSPVAQRVQEVRIVLGEAVRGLKLPIWPWPDSDLACLRWAPLVTSALSQYGVPARTASVTGWQDRAGKVIAFMHKASVVSGPLVADCTAQQFNPDLPPLWVATIEDYCRLLAARSGVPEVSVRVGREELRGSQDSG